MNRAALLASITLALLAGCGKKAEPPAAGSGTGSGSSPPATTADAAVAAPDAAAAARPTKQAPTAIPKEVRAEYKKRLAAGRKASKAARWPEAITELEAALTAIPGDDRALAELSWAALSSGDAEKARKSARQAVLVTTDPKLKAAALYNLGRAEEPTDAAKAAALYKESIALRPNKIVEQRLADLAGKVTFTPDPLPCTTPGPEAAVCKCLNDTVTDLEPDVRACDLSPTGLPDFKTATYKLTDLGEEQVALVARSSQGWSVVALLEYVYNPGAFGIFEEWKLESATDEQVGGHSLARFVVQKERQDSDMGIDEVENESTTTLVVCVRDMGGEAPTCPLDVQTDYQYVRDRLGIAEEGDLADMGEYQTKGLPIKARTTLDVTIDPSGVAKIRAERGRVDPANLGDRKLW